MALQKCVLKRGVTFKKAQFRNQIYIRTDRSSIQGLYYFSKENSLGEAPLPNGLAKFSSLLPLPGYMQEFFTCFSL